MLRRNLAPIRRRGLRVPRAGRSTPSDRGPDAGALCRGLTDAEASAIAGHRSGGLGFWVAALRECFEEAGVMLAPASDGRTRPGADLLDTRDPAVRRGSPPTARGQRGAHRAARRLPAGGPGAGRRHRPLREPLDHPELAPRRYDTRFFITVAPPGQEARHDDGETIATIWVRPADALARSLAGEIEMLPPTITNLTNIRRSDRPTR